MCGGTSAGGIYCGSFCVSLYDYSGRTRWNIGAALSFNLWYYFYQSSGTRYALRGGSSAIGFACGTFSVALHNPATNVNWNHGAALSFKPVSFVIIL